MRASRNIVLSSEMQALLEALRADGARLFGAEVVVVEPLTFEMRESSQITRARVVAGNTVRHVFAKVLVPRRSDSTAVAEVRARLRRDYSITRHVFEAMHSTAGLRAVEPLMFHEELAGSVTVEAPGVRLDTLIAQAARWPAPARRLSDVEAAVRRLGRWIATFQRVAPDPTPSPMDLGATREYIDLRLQRLVALPEAEFHEADRRALLDYFDRTAAEVPLADLVEVPVHGDITPSNILVAPDRVTVIDFAMSARGSRYLDLARLHTQLEFYTAKPHFRRQVIDRLQRSAIAGFDTGLPANHPLFEICSVQHVVCHFLSHARQPGRFPRNLYSRHQCRLHRRWLREKTRHVGRVRVPSTPSASAAR